MCFSKHVKVTGNMESGAAKRPRRILGIVRDAAAIGVTRFHLWRVLTGRRQSRSLLERYQALHGSPKERIHNRGDENDSEN